MNKYLIVYEFDGEETEPKIETANQIFNKMDMDDCYPIIVKEIYWLKTEPYFSLIKCHFLGTWHDFKNPLLMEIVRDNTNETIDSAIGSDH